LVYVNDIVITGSDFGLLQQAKHLLCQELQTNDLGQLGDEISDPSSYRRMVGRLIYLTETRPYIVHAVNILSQFMHKPCQSYLDTALRLLLYLKASPSQGFLLSF
ncbi:hypothetical protein CFOL_v3_01147, partial [Cephalotus follicularis]